MKSSNVPEIPVSSQKVVYTPDIRYQNVECDPVVRKNRTPEKSLIGLLNRGGDWLSLAFWTILKCDCRFVATFDSRKDLTRMG